MRKKYVQDWVCCDRKYAHAARTARYAARLDKLPTYADLNNRDRSTIRSYIDYQIEDNYLMLQGEEYPSLRLSDKAEAVLFRDEPVFFVTRETKKVEKADNRRGTIASAATVDESLLSALKALRFNLAKEQNVPAYIVFSNASLIDMAEKQPESLWEFMQVSGVGEVKAERYAEPFLAAIKDWKHGQR